MTSTKISLIAIWHLIGMAAFMSGSSISHAQNKTAKLPDIVFECRDAASAKAANCRMSCNDYYPTPANIPPTPGNPGGPGMIFPRLLINFERIEFFSQADRQSENWIAILMGYPSSTGPVQPAPPIRPMFYTIGSGNICLYTGGGPVVNGVDSFSVQMISYYGQN